MLEGTESVADGGFLSLSLSLPPLFLHSSPRPLARKVTFECGASNALSDVDEPSTCVYTAKFRTPLGALPPCRCPLGPLASETNRPSPSLQSQWREFVRERRRQAWLRARQEHFYHAVTCPSLLAKWFSNWKAQLLAVYGQRYLFPDRTLPLLSLPFTCCDGWCQDAGRSGRFSLTALHGVGSAAVAVALSLPEGESEEREGERCGGG